MERADMITILIRPDKREVFRARQFVVRSPGQLLLRIRAAMSV